MQPFESPRVEVYMLKINNYPFFHSLMHLFVHPHNVKYKTIISEPLIVLCVVTKKDDPGFPVQCGAKEKLGNKDFTV